jgi:hypothetical protein
MAACYNGPNPVNDDERLAIWRWAKQNAIDQGLPFDKVHEAINQHFFGGAAKSEWINDILSGRKTPFRFQANSVWKAQSNRRLVIQQAKQRLGMDRTPPLFKAINFATGLPRHTATFGHAVVFPISHAGDLAFRPASWSTFFKGIRDTYGGAFNPAFHARVMASMEQKPLFTTALRSGLDVGPKTHDSGLISGFLGRSSQRAWDMLKAMRYELWEKQMDKHMKPDMSNEEVLDLGKNLAGWANHATGSVQKSMGKYSGLLFGPKLTGSKAARLVADPWQTLKTFANLKNATPGEKAAARIRLSGALQYATSLGGFLIANQALLTATGSNQQVNFTDPTKSDFWSFKGAGLEGGFPGMHSELRTLGQILATSWASEKQLRGESRIQHAFGVGGKWLGAKAAPGISEALQGLYGQNYLGRPMPWSSDPGKITKSGFDKRKLSWGEFLSTLGPIPLQGPIGFVYDKLRQGGASALDSSAIIKGLTIFGLGATGLHVKEEPPAKKQTLQQAVGRARAATQLQAR